MNLFDVHTHVQFAAFKEDWREVIARALENNTRLINVGTQKDTSRRALEISREYPEGVYATVGLHPIHTEKSYHDPLELGLFSEASTKEDEGKANCFAFSPIREAEFPMSRRDKEIGGEKGFESRGEEFDYEYYRNLAGDAKVVAIGECGLDYYRLIEETKARQKTAFERQIALAAEIKKPLMIHCRQAFGDLIDILTLHSQLLISPCGAVHFFSGTKEDAKKLLDLGFSFSFGGVITFAREYDEVVKYIPLERLLLETDAPYVTPHPYRGKRNEPLYVVEVAKRIAELKSKNVEEVAYRTAENAEKIFIL